jgi:predicted nucleic-acid-binding Zn-ribbon protein
MLICCPICRQNQFFDGIVNAQDSHIVIRPETRTFTTGAKPRAAVCVNCGYVHLYLSEEQLEKVKEWEAKGK